MDDLNKEALKVWSYRVKLERIKKRINRIEAIMATEEYADFFNLLEKVQLEDDVRMLRMERDHLEALQLFLEEKIKLPNPYQSMSFSD